MMSALLWGGCGAACASCVMYLALGISRPLELKHVAFASAMFLISCLFALQHIFYFSENLALKIELVRWEIVIAILFFASFGWFLSLYTQWHPSHWMKALGGGYMAIALIYNQVSPYSLYFVSQPQIAHGVGLGGEKLLFLDAPVNLFMLSFVAFEFLIIAGGLYLVVKRKPSKKCMLAALTIGLASVLADFIHDAVGGTWPYTAEFSAALMALLMSLELAFDFRRKEDRLARAMDRTIQIRDQLNTPLQSLIFGLDLLATDSPQHHKDLIDRLKVSVARLEVLGRGLHKEQIFKS